MRRCPNLASLDFSLGAPGDVTAHRLVDALHHAPMLTSLNVANCSNVDDRILIPLSRCKRLAYINVDGTSVTSEGVEWLVSGNPAVEVQGHRGIKDTECVPEEIRVAGADGVDDASLLLDK